MSDKSKEIQSGYYRAPMGRARGLGAAHEGPHHWLHQRVTAVSNFVLMGWLVYSVVTVLAGASYVEFTSWLAFPVNAILLILAIASVFYHALLGTQVITEDYVHNEFLKLVTLFGLRFAFIGGAVASIFSILKIAFAG